jgi:hypothetical protein
MDENSYSIDPSEQNLNNVERIRIQNFLNKLRVKIFK